MREVNFSIPNVNKASVGITTALYDRRALDCTSTLPLINSLNHLAYLTTSSARIRDILTVDGGVERLVCLLKAGRSKDMMDMWKWNLAFQCVVNIGVRGSESVRTRVVEADMVPVIATILDNYIKVVDRCREKAEEAKHKALQDVRHGSRSSEHRSSHKGASFGNRTSRFESEFRASRRQPPPPSIEIPTTYVNPPPATASDAMETTPTGPQFAVTSPPERTTFSGHRHHHHHHRGQDARQHFLPPSRHNIQPLATAVPSMDTADGFNLRPVRDVDRLPSMVPGFHGGLTSQPESPTTPLPPNQLRSPTVRATNLSAPAARSRRRPSIRHQASMVGEPEDPNADSMASDESGDPEISGASVPEIQSTTVNIEDINMDDGDSMLTAVETPLGLTTPTVSETQDAGTFNITHRSAIDGSMINDATTPTGPTMGLSPAQQTTTNTPPAMPNATIPRYLLDRHTPTSGQVLAAMPRDEDVLMSLQLLAYVSKYCNLRDYFQQSHLVPKLKIGSELHLLDIDETHPFSPSSSPSTCHSACDSEEEEYLLPDDFNIFPLVEKFTVRHHSQDMQYWAGVVMRNLCRKDDNRGGIRQCAYYQCGKWEEYTRQFAKCRRCRRTKYCSKECQKSAWVFHRHWCVAATQ
ncbi:MYND-type zinc finger protein samB [Lachnellula arida]|uniref:MYND-type zinc finger protein samB n=2 Tax=Lachnellula TaxID=47830 RepID=A0A8T9BFA5_9HELO|nr:MYND-type zinc finger protein samB [Lachnellula arida]TVY87132.1 MYND-type zinc finger protein [Lachnellula willkommii]